MPTASGYPTSIDSYTVKVNHIDVYDADHIDYLQNSVIALQTYVGTNPHGTKNDFATRVNVLLNGSGVVVNSTGFPADTTPMRMFYRTDSETLFIRRFDNTAWQAVGQTQSNTIFAWNGIDNGVGQPVGSAYGMFVGTGSLQTVISSTAPNMYYFAGASHLTYPLITSKFSKVQGITTLKFYTRAWASDGGQVTPVLNFTGFLVGTGATLTTTAPTWSLGSIDVSGLTNGTVYDMVVSLSNDGSAATVKLSAVIIFGQ